MAPAPPVALSGARRDEYVARGDEYERRGVGGGRGGCQYPLAPALKSRLKSEASLFLFAREPDGRGPPLAAKRLTSAAIGTQVHLTAADSMMPGRVLLDGKRVSITARISFSGQPIPAAGDLYGECRRTWAAAARSIS